MRLVIYHCRVMKLADMPSRLEGGDNGINQFRLTNRSVEVRVLPLQHFIFWVNVVFKKGHEFSWPFLVF